MKTITRLFKRTLDAARRVFARAVGLSKRLLAAMLALFKRGTFALPQDEFEKLQVLQSVYKALNVALVIAVLVAGVWLSKHDHPSWTALLILALRLLYALPARRVERALRNHQYRDREQVRLAQRPRRA